MTLGEWSSYLALVLIALFTPGPAMLAIAAHAVERGPRATMPVVLGNAAGAMAMMAISLAGIVALLAKVEGALAALRVGGAAYLCWIGLRNFRTTHQAAARAAGGGFARGLLIAASNPAALLFYAAVLPQFVDRSRPVLPRLLVLAATLGTLELAITAAVAGFARAATRAFASARALRRAGGALLIAAAALVAFAPVRR